jgi:hypothetical protein
MTTTQRPRTPRRPPSNNDAASRGLILVVVAIAVGAILLWKGGSVGFDSDGSSVDIGAGVETTTTAAPDDTTTTTAAPDVTVAPAQVKVVVANGAGVSGLAGATTEFLATQGYSNSVATDAISQVPVTAVYAAEGFEGNATVIAGLFGVDPATVQPLPAEPLAGDQPADAGLVVVVGPDAEATVAAGGAAGDGGDGSETTTTVPAE